MCEQGTLVVAFHTSSVHKTMYQGDEWHVASPLPKGCSHRVANFHRYPEGGTSRTLTGPKGTRGPTDGAGRTEGERRRERAKPKQPHPTKAKTSKATEEEKTTTTKGQHEPAAPQKHHKERTQTKQHPTHKDKQSRPKQITGRKTQAPAHHPEKDNEKENTQETEGLPDNREERGQKKLENEKKWIKACECTCPVCGQTHKH